MKNRFFRENNTIVPFIKVLKTVTRFNGEIEVYYGTNEQDRIISKDKERLKQYLEWLNEDCTNCCNRQKPWNKEK